MSRLGLKAVLLLVTLTSCVYAYVPAKPVWPQQWHSSILATDSTSGSSTSSKPIDFNGQYYYDNGMSMAAFVLTNPTTGRRQLQQVQGATGTVFETDLTSGACTHVLPNQLPAFSRLTYLQPGFLNSLPFQFVDFGYQLRDGAYHMVQHWSANATAPAGGAFPIDYYHSVELNSPYMLVFGGLDAAHTPTIVEFLGDFTGGLWDVSQDFQKFLFAQFSPCNGNSAGTTGVASALLQATAQNRVSASRQVSARVSHVASDWPLQFNTKVQFTGNEFGSSNLFENITVPQQIGGYYYYDWPDLRESSYWENLATSHRAKTVIVDGKYHAIQLDTGACVIVPTNPVNGPLKYNWTQNLQFYETTWARRAQSFVRVQHYFFDAFGVGFNNSFHYHQYENGIPFRFQGPVLEFSPFGQSFTEYSEFIAGLDGIDQTSIYGVPTNCTAPFSSDASTATHPLQAAFSVFNRF